ncbi:LysR family transcriptional regulator [Sulfitobacter sp. M57]|uniref:hydrogen peroxide-inducible genes activator n=1 Tax=unclassified Sulfitobacter TaxID=196795 RepID=UPI0023E21B8A|nr:MULTISPECIES: hydrogen peroxide-inducible genes activator [unclassified Sulfitobacter]MDF3413117.1 LysR family transcriptional regulator [Sulfitobacter sp. KE5]MDF3421600.1 LysR family transcriptional regulator [Sulfitobacter sp. KE43]MDF3431666.1 LysR family transcriptional regulator [Sulfitobacter sp. KE42]MDF3457307.1 LysR family transcriptional regulator [Sulfitobacter sp. S74]MDF3461209.1 LysR family transcriptional regulator [Sulfitobacter sp. Ks18]
MTNFTIRQLRYFEALAQHKHFGRAAEASSVSQPALSVQIKELEESLGTLLVERAARQVQLTAFGEAFLERVAVILRSVDELDDFARAAKGQLSGRFRLGVIPTIAPYLLPALIGKLNQSHPAIDLHVRETLTPRLVQEVQQGRLDTAIVALPVSEPALTEMALFSENFLLVRPQSAAHQPAPRGEDLRDMRLLLLEEGHCLRDQTLSFCHAPTAISRDGLDGSSLSTLVQMVGAGIGVTMIPQMAVEVETRSADVSCTSFSGSQPGRTVGMIWRKSNPLSEAFASVAEVVRSCGPPQL